MNSRSKRIISSPVDQKKIDYDHVIQRGLLSEANYKSAEYLYLRLAAIDSKVSGLLTFNSIFVATIAFLEGSDAEKKMHWMDIGSLGPLPIAISLIFWLLSIILCLWISRLKWQSILTQRSGCIEYLKNIVTVTTIRTRIFNLSLYAIMVALAFLLLPIFYNLWLQF